MGAKSALLSAAALALALVAGTLPSAERQTWLSERYSNPLFSPDRQFVALEAFVPPRNYEIFVARADGSELRNLTRHAAEDISPRWSPDGRWIVFKSDRDGAYGLFRMRPDGTEVAKIPGVLSMFGEIGWSPDSRSIVYDSREGVMIVAADASGPPKLVIARGRVPILSPDGRWILYRGGPRHDEVHVAAADGSSARKIADGYAITWTPDGAAIFFRAPGSRHAFEHIYRIAADGSGRKTVLRDVLLTVGPDDPRRLWSPDGSRLALSLAEPGWLIPRTGLVIVDREGNVVRDLRKREWFICDATLSWRDDRTVAMAKLYNPPQIETRLAADPGGIYLVDAETGRSRQIVRNREIVIDPDNPPW